MRIKRNRLTVLLVTGGAAGAIVATRQTPDNVKITSALPTVGYRPYGNLPWLIGRH
jgi:hypothetical protein